MAIRVRMSTAATGLSLLLTTLVLLVDRAQASTARNTLLDVTDRLYIIDPNRGTPVD